MQLVWELHLQWPEPDEAAREKNKEEKETGQNETQSDRDAAFGRWHFAGAGL
jgi:hypothetical protein